MATTLVYTDPNAEIVQRCRNGERKAQYELYKLYAKSMFNVSMRIVNDYAEAEDVLQESFVSAFSELNSFKEEASFGSWLKRIVVNKAIGKIRAKRLQWIQLGEQDFADQQEATDCEEAAWQAEQIRFCIQKLPDGYRVVLSLYLLEGYDHAEIAEVLGITEATSKSQYHRAKKKLLELVKKHQSVTHF